jgi:hypothetical protein
MPPLEHPRHELMAQELAKGETQRKAYETAGYRFQDLNSLDSNASHLTSNNKVKERVIELQQEAAKSISITLDGQIAKLQALLEQSTAHKQYASAIAAVREQNELAGLRVQRSEVKTVDQFDSMSDEELRAYVEGKE